MQNLPGNLLGDPGLLRLQLRRIGHGAVVRGYGNRRIASLHRRFAVQDNENPDQICRPIGRFLRLQPFCAGCQIHGCIRNPARICLGTMHRIPCRQNGSARQCGQEHTQHQ